MAQAKTEKGESKKREKGVKKEKGGHVPAFFFLVLQCLLALSQCIGERVGLCRCQRVVSLQLFAIGRAPAAAIERPCARAEIGKSAFHSELLSCVRRACGGGAL